MELDELKKSWNALDEQLKKEPIADEKQIAGMIAEYKANARKSIGRLTGAALLHRHRSSRACSPSGYLVIAIHFSNHRRMAT